MSTLKDDDFKIMEKQLEDARGKVIQKEKVLKILHDRLKDVDAKNDFIVDRIDGVLLKDLINSISQLK